MTGDSGALMNQFVAIIPSGLAGADELLGAIGRELHFPGYYGMNWNALLDCLRDLTWIDEKCVLIKHTDLSLIPKDDLLIYYDVLVEAAKTWETNGGHALLIFLPNASRVEFTSLMKYGDSVPHFIRFT
jgi:hypothetical protein